ncbi:MAG: hypothetical protein KDD64_17165, partial [Bdellovibrionales bacterium]|nr:hypothetical protein [Bdellovibrionales bacterium]
GPIGGTGLYNAPIDGGMIKSVGDSDHPWNPLELFPVKNFLNPATNGTGVALIGGTVFGYFGLFYSALPSTGAENFSLLVGPETALPGSSGAAGDTKLFAPSTQMDGTRIGFIGRDESANLIGVFVTNPSGSSFETIVTNKMNLAGISTFPDSSINPFSFAMDGTNTLFLVYSGHNDQSLFLKTSSGIERVADPSLTLNGIPLYDFSEVTPYALDGERFVFAYSTITFPRSVLVLAGPPSDFPGDDPESSVQQLVADAQSQLVQAKKKLPKGKKKKDVRQSIRDARSSIQEIVDSLFGIFDSSEVAVLNLTQKRLKQLRTLSKKGSRAKATDQVRKRSWKKVGKLLKALL